MGTAGETGEAAGAGGGGALRPGAPGGSSHPAELSDGAGERRVWPWGGGWSCSSFSPRLWAAEPTRKAALLLPGPQHRPHDDSDGGEGQLGRGAD